MDPAVDPASPRTIALCLSGGGLRATFFHLGVVEALRRSGRLKEVKEVFSVSGGSITAAHLALNWARYTGSDEDFDKAATELRAIADWDIRGRVLRRWILSCAFVLPRLLGYGRTEFLQQQYERLTANARLRDIAPAVTGGPRFYFLSTSFNTGNLCSFSDDAFTLHHLEDYRSSKARRGDEKPPPALSYAGENIRLSLAVTASSAFPPMFPPVELGWEQIGGASQSGFNAIALTDGGVYDNLGLDTFLALADREGRSIDTVIVSDAGGTFSASIKNEFDGPISRNVRATDILMYRTAQATLKHIGALPAGIKGIDVSIAATSPFSRLSTTAQTRLQSIRTDLDAFSKHEVDLLIEHGRGTARRALSDGRLWPADVLAKGPDTPDFQNEAYERAAREARKRRIGLENSTDWAYYALILTLGIGIICAKILIDVVTSGYRDNREALEQNKVVRDQIEYLQKTNAELSEQNRDLTKRAGPQPEPPTTPPVSSGQPAGPPRGDYTVWTQFAGTLTRDEMRAFNAKLAAGGWKVPGAAQGGERTGRAAGLNEVRYGPGTDQKAAQQLADDINATGTIPTQVKLRLVSIIPKNSLEIWISN